MEKNQNFVAYIDYDEDGKLMINIVNRTRENLKKFND